MSGRFSFVPDADWTFERYEAIRARLPHAEFPETSSLHDGLLDLADRYDAFLFDAFGVLNFGETAIPGARDCINALRARGKRTIVLSNAATSPLAELPSKYQKLGFDFSADEIVSSRGVLGLYLAEAEPRRWAIAAPPSSRIEELVSGGYLLGDDESGWRDAEGFILLSSQDWSEDFQARMIAALAEADRPVLIGNPDLVAPREWGLSLEPGYFAHAIADAVEECSIDFFGKPFANAFDAALAALGDIPRDRIAMVGDTLHTDILGGAAAGLKTVLVTDWGVLKGRDHRAAIARSGIVPDHIVPAI